MDTQAILAKIKQYPLAVGFGVGCLILGVLIYLRSGENGKLQTELDTLKGRNTQIEANLREGTGMVEDLARLKEMVEAIEKRLVNREERVLNVQYFYNFDLEQELINITSVNQLPPNEAAMRTGPLKIFETVDFNLVCTGTKQQLLQFLHEIRRGGKILKVTSISLDPEPGLPNESNIRLTLACSVLARKTAPPAPGARR